MNSFTFWDITPCSPLKFNRLFAEICCCLFQVRGVSQASDDQKANNYLLLLITFLAYSLNLKTDVVC
jgi:hypothetical protein